MKNKNMRLLGLDPGLRHTGWGMIESNKDKISWLASGNISPKTDDSIAKRLMQISRGISNIIEQYDPEAVAIEDIFMGKNVQSALKLGMARGVAINACASLNVSVYQYEATVVKKATTGFGRANKEQVYSMVKFLLPGVICKSDDESDALAVAICHSQFASSKINHSELDNNYDS
jgi:crossover junction endodeoxyribonuclease RuvC